MRVTDLIYLKLIYSFSKIGLFGFGGGYAMVPFIQDVVMNNGWMTSSEFANILVISQMTPGPISVNAATYVGYKTAGLLGGFAATMGVALPSIVLIYFVSKYFNKFQDLPIIAKIFYGIRPVVLGLIISAALFIGQTSLLKGNITSYTIKWMPLGILEVIDIKGVFILLVTLVSILKFKMNPMLVIVVSGLMGILFYPII